MAKDDPSMSEILAGITPAHAVKGKKMSDTAGLHVAGLEALLAAVHAGDPKRELLVRVGDAIREAKAIAAQQDGAERLRNLAADLMDLVDEMPIKHPQQATRRDIMRGQCKQFGVYEQRAGRER